MNDLFDLNVIVNRRQFFRKNVTGLGAAALASMLPKGVMALGDDAIVGDAAAGAGVQVGPHFAPKAKRVIYMSMIRGKASMGSWLSYGLGSMNHDFPTFVVLHAYHTNPKSNVQVISAGLWGSGFLPGQHADSSSAALGLYRFSIVVGINTVPCSGIFPSSVKISIRERMPWSRI